MVNPSYNKFDDLNAQASFLASQKSLQVFHSFF
jgi:hypothetical protein